MFISDALGDSDVEEQKRPTLLDIIEEKNRASNIVRYTAIVVDLFCVSLKY